MSSIEVGQPEGMQPDGFQPGGEAAPPADPGVVRMVFRARPAQQLFVEGARAADNVFTFEPVVKDAGDTLPIKLEFGETDAVAFRWERDELVNDGEFVLPRTPNGFAMQAIGTFTTGAVEPPWPSVLDGEVPDGGGKWRAVPKGLNGTATLSSPVPTPDDPLLLINGIDIDEGTALVFDYAGGVYGGDYEIKFGFLVAGKARVARQVVKVRKL